MTNAKSGTYVLKLPTLSLKGQRIVLYDTFYKFVLYYYSLCAINFKKQKNKANAKKSPMPSGMEKMFC
jgi:hypothetical protein